ncbi:response regulator [Brucepastera parasyntrophica]|uniref:ATP-binding protein n=1 Tax=Brucepastera parasyntrophica TaxID=2880008 RepID=UPI00210AE5C6|nr:ATP-binding protein [Brucepastera parasyntrophica]ULQ58760.1 response regulator [Brucepastera parasyntrophica]
MTNSLYEKNSELQKAFKHIETSNRDLQAEIETRLREIIMQDELLHTVNDVASILLASDVDEFETSLQKCMEMMATTVGVDRMYIWKNHNKDGQLCCTQLFEWSEGAEPQQGTEYTTDVPYVKIPGWIDTLPFGQCINGLVKNLSRKEQEHLLPQGIVSILVVPVFLQDKFWGFVGFDDCHTEREFSEGEETILRSGSLLIANALLRNEMTQNLVQAREEALSSTRAKGDFLAKMSHEIRTPINAITGMAAIARKSGDMDRINDCLDKIDAASNQLLGLINDILDMSKIEAGKLELAHEPFNLIAAIYNIKSIIGVRAAEKKQDLIVNIAPDVPDVVVGDDMRLTQVLINLLSNAVKFTPEQGEIKLTLSRIDTRDAWDELEVSVRDNGIGISSGQLEHLFNAFEQADRGTARRFGGTGLGLAITKSIIELMDGEISVESTPGEGSCFTLRFRIERGSTDMLNPRQEEKEAAVYQFGGYTALLAEDMAINREIVIALLEDTGIEVECAENGQLALDLFEANPERYDIIFMDIHMPILDGYTASEKIRKLDNSHARTVPIIAMTANAFSEDVERCKKAGMNEHIAKPIDAGILLQTVASYLT